MLNALKIRRPTPSVLPQQISPLPQYYRELGPRSVTVNSLPITPE